MLHAYFLAAGDRFPTTTVTLITPLPHDRKLPQLKMDYLERRQTCQDPNQHSYPLRDGRISLKPIRQPETGEQTLPEHVRGSGSAECYYVPLMKSNSHPLVSESMRLTITAGLTNCALKLRILSLTVLSISSPLP